MALAALFVALAIITVILKAFKWPKQLLFVSFILVLVACKYNVLKEYGKV